MAKLGSFVLFGVLMVVAVVWASPLVKVTESSESSEDSGETGELLKEIQELCKNNSGSDDTFMQVMESAQSAMMCGVAAIDMENLMSDIETLSNETRTEFFTTYCPQLLKVSTCIDKLVTDFRPCLEPDDYTIVQALVGIYPDALNLLCKNNGAILFIFDEPQYADCLAKIGDNFDECIDSFLNTTDDWDFSNMTRDQCGMITGFRQCLQSKLNLCKAPDLIGVYDLFHNALFRMTSCRNFVMENKIEVIDNNELNEV